VTSDGTGLALWLEDRSDAGMYVTGFRFDATTRFASIPTALLVDDASGLAPDRLPGASLKFDPKSGLTLDPSASVFVTDVTFADFDLDLEVVGAAPTVVLRRDDGREIEIGGASCPIAVTAQRTLSVERASSTVTVTMDDRVRQCPPVPTDPTPFEASRFLEADARLSIGLRGTAGGVPSGARNLRIRRR
jgi:hypothetical protein